MEEIIEVKSREKLGTRATIELRKAGSVPAVLYGKGIPSVHFSVDRKLAEEIMRHTEKLLKVKVGKAEAVPALIQDVQLNAISGEIIHFDALVVRLDEKVEMSVTVEIFGADVSPGIQEGGALEINVHEVMVSCFPDRIPEKLEIDASQMVIGDIKHVSDLVMPEGVELLGDLEENLILISEPVEIEAATDIEASLEELEGAEPTVQKQKEDEGETAQDSDNE